MERNPKRESPGNPERESPEIKCWDGKRGILMLYMLSCQFKIFVLRLPLHTYIIYISVSHQTTLVHINHSRFRCLGMWYTIPTSKKDQNTASNFFILCHTSLPIPSFLATCNQSSSLENSPKKYHKYLSTGRHFFTKIFGKKPRGVTYSLPY